jgi:catechol 2,3-dioxygenase-like lactoylglutathione lyase family enzyme
MEINHVGISVGDIDRAVEWYRDVLGFEVLVEAGTHTLSTANGERRKDVFGPRWREMRLAHLATPSGIGVELFQFVDPPSTPVEDPFEYWRHGIFHLCVTVEDLESTLGLLRAADGVVRTEIHTVRPGTRVVYCEDPWGTIIELSSGTYPQITGTAE